MQTQVDDGRLQPGIMLRLKGRDGKNRARHEAGLDGANQWVAIRV